MLWVDQHRPGGLDELDYHPRLTELLSNLSERGDFPHLLFYGPSGAGKKTRILALLNKMYGASASKVKVDTRSMKVGSTTTDIEVMTSNHHMEVCPSDVGNKDRVVVQHLIKEMASSPMIGAQKFRIMIIDDADQLTAQAQAGLRRTMEKYVETCRLILVCNSLSQIIPPLQSRCVLIRVAAPSNEEVAKVLYQVAKKEDVQVPEQYISAIVEHSKRDLRRALLLMEAGKAAGFQGNIARTPWEQYIEELVKIMLKEQTPKALMDCRKKLYELLTSCIPPEVILKTMLDNLLQAVKGHAGLTERVIFTASHYEHTMRQGTKEIYHLEAFVARFMSDFRNMVAAQ